MVKCDDELGMRESKEVRAAEGGDGKVEELCELILIHSSLRSRVSEPNPVFKFLWIRIRILATKGCRQLEKKLKL